MCQNVVEIFLQFVQSKTLRFSESITLIQKQLLVGDLYVNALIAQIADDHSDNKDLLCLIHHPIELSIGAERFF